MRKLTLWAARDFNGDLSLYGQKPERKGDYWYSGAGSIGISGFYYCRDLTWEDEPREVTLEL